jgi:hypothetical protein
LEIIELLVRADKIFDVHLDWSVPATAETAIGKSS